MSSWLYVAIGAGLLAVLYGAVQTARLLKASPGDAKMQEIAAAILEGAQAYLNRQYTTIAIVGVVVVALLAFFFKGWEQPVAFALALLIHGASSWGACGSNRVWAAEAATGYDARRMTTCIRRRCYRQRGAGSSLVPPPSAPTARQPTAAACSG